MHYLIVNYKTYPQATGNKAVELSHQIYDAYTESNSNIELIICPQPTDMCSIHQAIPELQLWAQHVDDVPAGTTTGWITIDALKAAGASGILINHSEHPLATDGIKKRIELAQQHEMISCVATPTVKVSEHIVEFKPTLIAYEPPELISKGKSLVEQDPTAAQSFISALSASESELILGAGISSETDITEALGFGYKGVLIASAIVKADSPKQKMMQLLEAYI